MAKLIIKDTPETRANGSAGKAVQSVVGQEKIGETNFLTVFVSDGCGKLEGPYTLSQDQTEIKH